MDHSVEEIKFQEELLNIVLNDSSKINNLLNEKVGPNNFTPDLRPIFYALFHSNTKGVALTERSFSDFIEESYNNGNYKKWIGLNHPIVQAKASQRSKFSRIFLVNADANDLPVLIKKIKDNRLKRNCIKCVESFNINQKSNFKESLRKLSHGIDLALSENEYKEIISWCPIDEIGSEWYDKLINKIDNPEEKLHCSISEIDDAMVIGFKEGTLTLFVADVGGFKSTMMLNIALNIFKKTGESVLFCALEMPRDMVLQKIVARETGISFNKLENPIMLTEIDRVRIKDELKKWEDLSQKFIILDNEERVSVSTIRSQIEKYKALFSPKVVVVDYIANLKSDDHYKNLNESSQYGQMCKDLRQLGRKEGFSVVSAVQLGRDAIKRLRNQKEGKQTVGSDDLRGSHDYSADADNIFVMVPHPSEPDSKIQLFCVKTRYGSKTFNGKNSVLLDVYPDISKIVSNQDAKIVWDNSSTDKKLQSLSEHMPTEEDLGALNGVSKINNNIGLSGDEIFGDISSSDKDSTDEWSDDIDYL